VNQLYFGDNLNVLREHIKDESVDLIYLDPPFNSKRGGFELSAAPIGCKFLAMNNSRRQENE
jgi:16S rRNA G966 N2-methylase RsmD